MTKTLNLPGEFVREHYRNEGAEQERKKLIAILKSRICFNFAEGECPHGSCYDFHTLAAELSMGMKR